MIRFALIVVTILMLPTALGDEADAAQPTAAFVWESGVEIVLWWTPGTVVADHYHIYGIAADDRVLLAVVTDAMLAEVSSTYPAYEVTAVVDGVESPPTAATSGVKGPCIAIWWNPPGVTIGCMGGVPNIEAPGHLAALR